MNDFSWELIETRHSSSEAIMAKDLSLLSTLNQESKIILHLYEWEGPCLTYGYFIDPERYLYLDVLEQKGIGLARRPTGGGIIFHLNDFAFSILIPAHFPQFSLNTLENYAYVNSHVSKVVSLFSSNNLQAEFFYPDSICHAKECSAFCMAKPTQYDLLIKGKKVGGAAQRRTKQGLLHQGSLSLLPLSRKFLAQCLKNNSAVVTAMHDQSAYLLDASSERKIEDARFLLRELMKETMSLFLAGPQHERENGERAR